MTDEIELPAVMDLVAAPALQEMFLQRRGQDVCLNGAQVQRLGGQCLQVLLAARLAWAAEDHSLTLHSPSEDLITSLELMGLKPDDLTHQANDICGEPKP
ncbi:MULTISPECIES: STAS domain-containing protein [Acidocella]|uniref:STAS domain-containing protein n=1 Tax=Acidocella TaxID=50709 RepID=UPI00028E37FB|nr:MULTISPECIES: STAS domain-containing protein [Acidocella]EKN00118.1 hypothetical protein MXAZACID_07011 [Acidocella sp. MX-AZ02]WBO59691.1 STAS domain-containing protein [Acidocella sp. MX-AZ03]